MKLLSVFILIFLTGCGAILTDDKAVSAAGDKPCQEIVIGNDSSLTLNGVIVDCTTIVASDQGVSGQDNSQELANPSIPIEGGIAANNISTEKPICDGAGVSVKTCLEAGGQLPPQPQPQPVEG